MHKTKRAIRKKTAII